MRQTSTEIEAPVMELVRLRRSSRAFSDRPVDEDTIRILFEAARWAPSSRNEQPWQYLYATSAQTELWTRIFNSLTESNQLWVRHVPLLIVSMMRTTFLRDGQVNPSAAYDLGAANAFLTLQATALGLNVRQMGGFYPDRLREALRIPSDYQPVTVLAIGYAASAEMLSPDLQQREAAPRLRYRQADFVRNEIFPE
jgi:nitroreductase